VFKEAGLIERDPIKPGPNVILYDVYDMTDGNLEKQIWESNLDFLFPATIRPYMKSRFKVGIVSIVGRSGTWVSTGQDSICTCMMLIMPEVRQQSRSIKGAASLWEM
jgi:hypothetical protein